MCLLKNYPIHSTLWFQLCAMCEKSLVSSISANSYRQGTIMWWRQPYWSERYSIPVFPLHRTQQPTLREKVLLHSCSQAASKRRIISPWLVWLRGLGPVNWRVASSIPSQGTWLVCGPGPWVGPCKRQLIDVSLALRCFSPSLSRSLPLSLKINKQNKKKHFLSWNAGGLPMAKKWY